MIIYICDRCKSDYKDFGSGAPTQWERFAGVLICRRCSGVARSLLLEAGFWDAEAIQKESVEATAR